MDNRAPHVSQTISEKNLPIYGKDGPIKKAIESVFQYALK